MMSKKPTTNTRHTAGCALRAILNEPNFSKKIQSSKHLEPVRRRSPKCLSGLDKLLVFTTTKYYNKEIIATLNGGTTPPKDGLWIIV